MREFIDPECALATAYARRAAREPLMVLWRLDAMLGGIVAATREPALGAIRLLWWRDALAALDGAPPPAEPMLLMVTKTLLPAAGSGEGLAAMEAGWAAVLPGDPIDRETLGVHADERGGRLFALAARLLGGDEGDLARRAGQGWALVDLARRVSDPDLSAAALDEARDRLDAVAGCRWPGRLRPLGMLALLAAGDARAGAGALPFQGSPRRIMRMLTHRLTGH